MRTKMDDNEKKQKISINLEIEIDNLLTKEMEETGNSKSKIIEDVIKQYIEKNAN